MAVRVLAWKKHPLDGHLVGPIFGRSDERTSRLEVGEAVGEQVGGGGGSNHAGGLSPQGAVPRGATTSVTAPGQARVDPQIRTCVRL